MQMSLEMVIGLVGGLTLLVANLTQLFNSWQLKVKTDMLASKTDILNSKTDTLSAKSDVIHETFNHKMDKLMEYVRAEGVAEGKKHAEDEQARRDDINEEK